MWMTRKKLQCQWILLLFIYIYGKCAVSSDVAYFPSDVKICSANDPNLNTCFTTSANRMLKHLTKGLRKLNAVSLDPLNVPFISISIGNSHVQKLAFNFTDTIHEGWKDAFVLCSKVNPKVREFNITFRVPKYRVRGVYAVTGNVVGIRMDGSGDFDTVFTNMTHDVQMQGHLEERGSQEFLVFDHFRQKSLVDKLKVKFNNLFNNTQLSDVTNSLLNENNRVVLDEANGAMNELFGEIHAGLIQRIFDRVPYKAMFSDLE